MTTNIHTVYEKMKYQAIKQLIKELTVETKHYKQIRKETKDDVQRSNADHDHYLYSSQLSLCFNELNKMNGKNECQIKKKRSYFGNPIPKSFEVSNLILIYVDIIRKKTNNNNENPHLNFDNELKIVSLNKIRDDLSHVNVSVTDLLTNNKGDVKYLGSLKHFIVTEDYFLSLFSSVKTIKDFLTHSFDMFKIDLFEISNEEIFFNNVEKYQKLILLEKKYSKRRKKILES